MVTILIAIMVFVKCHAVEVEVTTTITTMEEEKENAPQESFVRTKQTLMHEINVRARNIIGVIGIFLY